MPPSAPDSVGEVRLKPDTTYDEPGRLKPAPTYVAMGAAAVLAMAWTGPIVLRMIRDGDFPFYLRAAETFASDGRITVPHFLLQVLLGGLFATGLFASIDAAAITLMFALHAATAAVICWFVAGERRTAGVLAASVVLAIAVLVAGPLLPSGVDDVFLIGYFPPNAYHSPTMIVAKPLLVLSLAAAIVALTKGGRLATLELAAIALPVLLLGIAKPNYLGCLVPVVALAAIWQQGRAREVGPGETRTPPVSWSRVATFCGAAAVTLGGTWLLYRSEGLAMGGGIDFAPLAVIGLYSPVDPATVAQKLLASVAFPLAAVALWPKAVWQHHPMRIALAALAIALFISYGLAESGSRMGDGNFLWTGQMGVLGAFVATAAFAVSRLAPRVSASTLARLGVLLAVLALHVQGGIRHAVVKVDPEAWVTWWR